MTEFHANWNIARYEHFGGLTHECSPHPELGDHLIGEVEKVGYSILEGGEA
jgi:hypothetical protein